MQIISFTYCTVVIFSYVTSNPQHFQIKDIALAYVPKCMFIFVATQLFIFTPSVNKIINIKKVQNYHLQVGSDNICCQSISIMFFNFNLDHNILFKDGIMILRFLSETKYGEIFLIYKTKLI